MTIYSATLAVGSIILATAGLPAMAVVISSGDGSGNTSNPVNEAGYSDFGFWGNVGLQGSGSAVYLGDNWVLTAFHINGQGQPSGVELNGQFYARDQNTTSVRLQNPDGGGSETDPSVDTDLRMFRLSQTPVGLPAVTMGTATPEVGDEVLMIGYGRDRQVALTYWDAAGNEFSSPSGATIASGYKWDSDRTKRWGANTIHQVNLITEASGFGDIHAVSTRFDSSAPDAVNFEAQAAGGDSGGAVFVRNGQGWALAGLMHSVGNPDNIPPVEAAIFTGQTFISDLSFYHDQILTVIPEPSTWCLLAVGLLAVGLRRRC